ncbi:MAG: LamG-like jellyroll fold domain-containing protein, partial [Sedimentisphaerales bacterium]
MCKKVIYLAYMVNVLNLEVCKMYSTRKARKVSLFRDFVLAVFLAFVGYMLTTTPAAYAGGGYALVFDGVDDYMDAENIYEKLSQLTVEFWMWRPESTSDAYRHILGNNQRHSFVKPITPSKEGFRFLKRLSPVGNLQFRVYEAEHNAGNVLSINTVVNEEWVHIAGVFNAGKNIMKIYVNGVEEASADVGGAAHTGIGTRFRIGQNTSGELCVPGTIVDEVRIWNYARTPEQIQEYMSIELSGSEDGLVGYWKLNEGEGATVFDHSPNQNHGTIAGATWTTEAAPVAAGRWFAYHPGPAGEATDVPRDVTLSWTPGVFANTHDVYFGTTFNDVNDADRTNPLGVLVSQDQDANTYDPVGVLDFGQTYYWRVDEVNGPPDFTVYEGSVWQFTTELFSYPIENITATASSQFNADTGPENTIDGSGLDVNDLHSTEETGIWVSSMTGPQPTWIQYEFDRVYRLHQMWVWNHNTSIELVLGFGIKAATVEYSIDGANWTTLGTTHEFARAPGLPGYAHNTTVDFGAVPAKYVKITANSNWGGVLPQYGL